MVNYECKMKYAFSVNESFHTLSPGSKQVGLNAVVIVFWRPWKIIEIIFKRVGRLQKADVALLQYVILLIISSFNVLSNK